MSIATIDNVFSWAAQQPFENTTGIQFAMTTNELTRNNLVSYSEGSLLFQHATSGVSFFLPAYFEGKVTQYFSNNRDGSAPFSKFATNPLTVRLNAGLPSDPRYSVVIKAPAWNAEFDVVPQMDATGVLTATLRNSLLTISLCSNFSTPPNPVH